MIMERKLLISSCLVSAHLEILDSGVLPLEQALKLQVRLGPMEKDDIHVHIVPVFVEKVLEKHGD